MAGDLLDGGCLRVACFCLEQHKLPGFIWLAAVSVCSQHMSVPFIAVYRGLAQSSVLETKMAAKATFRAYPWRLGVQRHFRCRHSRGPGKVCWAVVGIRRREIEINNQPPGGVWHLLSCPQQVGTLKGPRRIITA